MSKLEDDESNGKRDGDKEQDILTRLVRHSWQTLTVTFQRCQGAPFADGCLLSPPSGRGLCSRALAAKMHRGAVELFDPILRFIIEAER